MVWCFVLSVGRSDYHRIDSRSIGKEKTKLSADNVEKTMEQHNMSDLNSSNHMSLLTLILPENQSVKFPGY